MSGTQGNEVEGCLEVLLAFWPRAQTGPTLSLLLRAVTLISRALTQSALFSPSVCTPKSFGTLFYDRIAPLAVMSRATATLIRVAAFPQEVNRNVGIPPKDAGPARDIRSLELQFV